MDGSGLRLRTYTSISLGIDGVHSSILRRSASVHKKSCLHLGVFNINHSIIMFLWIKWINGLLFYDLHDFKTFMTMTFSGPGQKIWAWLCLG